MDVMKNVRGSGSEVCPRGSIGPRLNATRREFDVHVITFKSCRIYGLLQHILLSFNATLRSTPLRETTRRHPEQAETDATRFHPPQGIFE
jgi:hypothetical protein